MSDTDKLKPEQVFNRQNLLGAIFVSAIFFQVGMLFGISPRALGFLTIGWSVLHIGILAVIFSTGVVILHWLWEAVYQEVASGGDFDDWRIIKAASWIISTRGTGWLALILGAIVVLSFVYPARPYFDVVSTVLWALWQLAGLIFMLVTLLAMLATMLREGQSQGEVSRDTAIRACVVLIVFSSGCGYLFSKTPGGAECAFTSKSETTSANLLATLDDVYIVSNGDQVIFLSRASIEKVSCPSAVRKKIDTPLPSGRVNRQESGAVLRFSHDTLDAGTANPKPLGDLGRP